MADGMIRVCQDVIIGGDRLIRSVRSDPWAALFIRRVEPYEKRKETICVDSYGEYEAMIKLNNLIEGFCNPYKIANCTYEKTGDVKIEEVRESFSASKVPPSLWIPLISMKITFDLLHHKSSNR